jgi:hypothetical protein
VAQLDHAAVTRRQPRQQGRRVGAADELAGVACA